MDETKLDGLVQWLERRHENVMIAENAALVALKANDIEGYRKKMREKAELLYSMMKDSQDLLKELPDRHRLEVAHTIDDFSRNAGIALELNSPFYMSALLYNDDHKKGEPDNLAVFIKSLRDMAAENK